MAKKARKYVARLRKISAEEKIDLTNWEDEFLNSIDERLEKYGRAFADPDKGAMNAPLSLLQGLKIKQIKQKIKPKNEKTIKPKLQKPRKPLKTNKPLLSKKGFSNKKPKIKTLNGENE